MRVEHMEEPQKRFQSKNNINRRAKIMGQAVIYLKLNIKQFAL